MSYTSYQDPNAGAPAEETAVEPVVEGGQESEAPAAV